MPRAAYVHVPFCRHRCGYCNFSVLSGRDEEYSEAYLKALASELAMLRDPRPIDTLFIGGGTPTHLGPAWFARLAETVGRWLVLEPGGEFSVEANPSDVHPQLLDALASAGVNRISLGVQSFRGEKLASLERDHTGEVAERAIRAAADRIGNVSIDLIFGAPGERPDQWVRDLERALALPIDHLSTYGLTYEKGTRFWTRLHQGQLAQSDEEDELAMYRATIDRTAAAGWQHYEVSNFARPGRWCRHNAAYWEGRGWYAAGPGAARFVEGRREVNHRSPTTYIRRLLGGASPVQESEAISPETWARERAAFGLRMLRGVDLEEIQRESGIDLQERCAAAIAQLVEAGLLWRHGGRVRLTERGLLLSDSVVAEFL